MAVVKPPDLKINFEGAWKELYKVIPRRAVHILDEKGADSIYIEEKMKELEKKHKNMITIKREKDSEMVDDYIKKTIEARMETIYLKKELRELKAYHNRDNEYSEKSDEIIGKIIDKIYKMHLRPNIYNNTQHICFSNEDIYIIEMLEELRLTLPHIRKMVERNVKGIIRIDEKKKKSKRKLYKVHLTTVTKDNLEFTFDWEVTGKKLEYLKKQFNEREEISWHGLKMKIVDISWHLGKHIEVKKGREDVQCRS